LVDALKTRSIGVNEWARTLTCEATGGRVDHYNNLAVSMDPLFLHVNGKAGTGKTTVIKSMCAEINRLAAELSLPSPIFRAAPTGVVACNFGGSTLHSLVRLLV
jgi:Cdc6-like AAA superfamily ATPase